MLTFALVVLLLYPDGHTVPLVVGDGLSSAQCTDVKARAVTQLTSTLSVATMLSADCVPNREV